jgi:type I restriction enzyme M protein
LNHSLSAKEPPTQGNYIPINRDKASLDIFWLRDESLEDSDNLPNPDVLALEIVEDLEAALEQFREIANDLGTANRLKGE